MARLAGVDIPREKRVEVALTYIYGVGKTRSPASESGGIRRRLVGVASERCL